MFDIIIPIYNTKVEYLRECLESVLNQTFDEWKCYMVNGTPDDSDRYYDIHVYLQEMALRDERFDYYLNGSDRTGVSAQRNLAVSRGTNPYVVLLDSDDYLSLDWLQNLERNICDDYHLYYGVNESWEITQTKSHEIKRYVQYNRYHFTRFIPIELKGILHTKLALRTIGACVTRSDFLDCGGFDEEWDFMEDTEFFRKIHDGIGHNEGKRNSLFIDLISGYRRVHAEQLTSFGDEGDHPLYEEMEMQFIDKYGDYTLDKPNNVEGYMWKWVCDLMNIHYSNIVKFYDVSKEEKEWLPNKWEELLTPEEDDSIYD